MDKFDVMVETYGLQYFMDYVGVGEADVLRLMHEEGLLDPEDFEYDELEVDADE